ncbi:MAG TPA: hypothetical protein VK701_03820 [Solirubrobacteraceae bacterium]|jgi:hypothetical protein|nr:hypothetical protein [Solirubrobacteraceae bacterium]
MTGRSGASRIARAVAAALWPDVQSQRKLCRGAFAFSCAGHGGIVALLDEMSLAEGAVRAARECGLIALAARVDHGRSCRTYCTAAGYDRRELDRLAQSYPDAVELREVWIGEEDCDWATLALVSAAVREGMSRSGYATSEVTQEAAYQTVQSWNEQFLAALYPDYEPLPDGQIAAAARRRSILDGGGLFARAAWGDWADGVPKGRVRVLFEGKDGVKRYYLMNNETYDARDAFPFPLEATLEEFSAVGEVAEAHGDTL